jgi:hypothetical protein
VARGNWGNSLAILLLRGGAMNATGYLLASPKRRTQHRQYLKRQELPQLRSISLHV